jgi:hypothetical protein
VTNRRNPYPGIIDDMYVSMRSPSTVYAYTSFAESSSLCDNVPKPTNWIFHKHIARSIHLPDSPPSSTTWAR